MASVAAATSSISTPHTSKWMGRPQKSKLGSWVSRTTTRRGTKKIRRIVRLFGRFISVSMPSFATLAGEFHYSPENCRSQRDRQRKGKLEADSKQLGGATNFSMKKN